MKRLQLVTLLASAFLVASCVDNAATIGGDPAHSSASTWEHDNTTHWHSCNQAGCDEKFDEASHVFGGWEIVTNATFTSAGSKQRSCEECGFTQTKTIPQKTHTYSDDWTYDESDHWHECNDAGFDGKTNGTNVTAHDFSTWQKKNDFEHVRYCACGASEVEDHAWSEVSRVAATFDADGHVDYECSVCSATKTVALEKLEHSYEQDWSHDATHHWHECTDSGCTGKENGKDVAEHKFGKWTKEDETNHIKSCVCGEVIRNAHNWTETSRTEADYDHAGLITYTCSDCNATKTEDINQLTHNYSDIWSKDSSGHWHDCIDAGYKELNDGVVAHNFGEWTEKTPATPETAQVLKHTCIECEFEETKEGTPATGHNYSSEWSTNGSQHWHACTDTGCESKTNVGDHVAGDWIIDTPASYEAAGSKHKECTVCGYELATEAIAQKTHTYNESEWSKDTTGHWHACTDTGYTDKANGKDFAAHTPTDWIIDTPASYDAAGSKHKECSECRFVTETATIAKLEHSYSEDWSHDDTQHWHECNDTGYAGKTNGSGVADHTFGDWTKVDDNQHSKSCACGYTVTADHDWSETSRTPANYDAAGSIEYTCDDCGATKSETIAKLEHSYSEDWSHDDTQHWHECNDTGYAGKTNGSGVADHTFGDWTKVDDNQHSKSCACGYTVTVDHNWSETSRTPATYDAAGSVEYICNDCGATKSETIAKLEHNYSTEWSHDATDHWHACTDETFTGKENGKDVAAHSFGTWTKVDDTNHTRSCECGETQTAAHNWSETENVPATYEGAGHITYTCSDCGATKTDTLSQLTHNYASGWTSDASTHWHACTDEGYSSLKGSEAAHTWDGNWTEKSAATYESAQILHRTCTVCGYEDTKEGSSKLSHSYSQAWSFDTNDHWHACTDEGFEGKTNGKDITAHTPTSMSFLEPTYTSKGHTEGTCCSVCGAIIDGYEIPALNETDYTRSATNGHQQTMTETWTLKNPASIGLDSYVITKTFLWGFVTVADYSTGKQVKHDYTPYEFNKTFDGIELIYDESKTTLTVNVTKEGGYSFDNACLTFPSKTDTSNSPTNFKNTVIITGEPLTINAPEGTSDDGLSFWCSTTVDAMCQAIIDTDVSVIYSEKYTTANTRNGINESKLTINEGASLTTRGFQYGLKICYSNNKALKINGVLNISGTTAAACSSNSNNRVFNFASNLDVYTEDVLKQTGGTIDTNTVNPTSGTKIKHVMAIPTGSELSKYINFVNNIAVEPTTSSVGTLNRVCAGCGKIIESIELPMLSSTDYNVVAETTLISGSYYDTTTYTWKNSDYGTIEIHADKTLVSKYITAGGTVFSANSWTVAHPDAAASLVNGDLTITLTDDVEIDLGDTGPIDFTKFDSVTINGEGTLKITTNQKTAIKTNSLTVGSNVELVLDGTNYAKSTYDSTDRKSTFVGIVASSALAINGTVDIDNFYTAIYVKGTCTINSGANLDIGNSVYGFYTDAAATITNNGELTVNVVTSNAVGFYSLQNTVTYHFAGDSVTNITSAGTGFNIGDGNLKNNYTIRISDNAIFNAYANSTCIMKAEHFIVGNGTDGSTQCNATVNIESATGDGINFFAYTGYDRTFIVNCQKTINVKRSTSSTSGSGICFNNGKFVIRVDSNIKIENFGYAIYSGGAVNKLVINSCTCDHMITMTNCKNFIGGSYIPSEFTANGWLAS